MPLKILVKFNDFDHVPRGTPTYSHKHQRARERGRVFLRLDRDYILPLSKFMTVYEKWTESDRMISGRFPCTQSISKQSICLFRKNFTTKSKIMRWARIGFRSLEYCFDVSVSQVNPLFIVSSERKGKKNQFGKAIHCWMMMHSLKLVHSKCTSEMCSRSVLYPMIAQQA